MNWKNTKKQFPRIRKSLRLNPKNEQAWFDKGIVLRKLENYKGALEAFDEVTAISPENEEAWFNKAIVLSSLKKS